LFRHQHITTTNERQGLSTRIENCEKAIMAIAQDAEGVETLL